jgi:hypothetical protein
MKPMLMTMARRGSSWILAAAAVLYLAASISLALTKSPTNDEGWFANPAHNLATEGTLAMPVLEPTGSWLLADLTGIRQHTYWNMPLCMVAHAAWFRLAGFGLTQMRMLSVLAGLVVLGSWFVIIFSLTRDRLAASFGVFLLAIDYTFLWGAADGRPDMVCLALGSAGLASFLVLREADFTKALLVSNTLAAAGLFTHPNGLIAVVLLGFLIAYFDIRRLRFRVLLTAAVPYAIGIAGWLCYISEAPGSFLAQFAANASVGTGSRWAILVHPLQTVYFELLLYVAHFGWMPLWTDATSRWNVLIPTLYFGVILSAGLSGIRKHRGNQCLVLIAVIVFFILAANLRLQFYLVFAMPAYAAVVGLWIRYMSQRAAIVFVPLVLAPFLYLQGSTAVQLVRADKLHKVYLPAMAYVQRQLRPDSVVAGNSTAVFTLGFHNLVDDERLGYFSSVKPDFVVTDRFYPLFWSRFRWQQPNVEEYIRLDLAAHYEILFRNEYYTVYRRRTMNAVSASARGRLDRNPLPSTATE